MVAPLRGKHGPVTLVHPMFNPALIPPEIWSPRKVAELNAMLARLKARKIDRIVMPEAGSGFRGSNPLNLGQDQHTKRPSVSLVDFNINKFQ